MHQELQPKTINIISNINSIRLQNRHCSTFEIDMLETTLFSEGDPQQSQSSLDQQPLTMGHINGPRPWARMCQDFFPFKETNTGIRFPDQTDI